MFKNKTNYFVVFYVGKGFYKQFLYELLLSISE